MKPHLIVTFYPQEITTLRLGNQSRISKEEWENMSEDDKFRHVSGRMIYDQIEAGYLIDTIEWVE